LSFVVDQKSFHDHEENNRLAVLARWRITPSSDGWVGETYGTTDGGRGRGGCGGVRTARRDAAGGTVACVYAESRATDVAGHRRAGDGIPTHCHAAGGASRSVAFGG
jgi:hypothetical protein